MFVWLPVGALKRAACRPFVSNALQEKLQTNLRKVIFDFRKREQFWKVERSTARNLAAAQSNRFN